MLRGYKNYGSALRLIVAVAPLVAAALLIITHSASADILKSPDYQLQPTVGNSFGGSVGSSDYKLTDSGGEAAIGNGAGGSYKLGAGFVAELQHSINLYVEPAGLVGYWPMNEGAGDTVHDATANNNNGTAVNSPSWAQGKINGALQFNGSSNYIRLSGSGTYNNLGTAPFTVSFWINTTPNSSYASIIDNKTAGTNNAGYNFYINNSGAPIVFRVANGSAQTAVAGTNISDGNWHMITGVRDGSGLKLYQDGTLINSNSNGGNYNVNTAATMFFGSYSTSAGFLNGSLDDVKIYNRALSADEIEANYQAGLAGFNSGLVIPAVNPGTSQEVDADVIVDADAPYSLLTSEISPLTDITNPSNIIPSIAATIASPAAWVEGTTKGLGFTILSGPNGVPAQWNSGANYAAIPSSATSFYSRSGFSGGAKDVIELQYRLDVSGSQPAGQYQNNVVYTATITP